MVLIRLTLKSTDTGLARIQLKQQKVLPGIDFKRKIGRKSQAVTTYFTIVFFLSLLSGHFYVVLESKKEWMNIWIILIFRVLSYSKRHYFAILTRLIHPWGLLGPNKEKEMQNSKENSLDKHYVVEQRKLNYFLSFSIYTDKNYLDKSY